MHNSAIQRVLGVLYLSNVRHSFPNQQTKIQHTCNSLQLPILTRMFEVLSTNLYRIATASQAGLCIQSNIMDVDIALPIRGLGTKWQ